jgi:hypothetical protein
MLSNDPAPSANTDARQPVRTLPLLSASSASALNVATWDGREATTYSASTTFRY